MFAPLLLLAAVGYGVAILLLGSLIGRSILTAAFAEFEARLIRETERELPISACLDEMHPVPSSEDLAALAAAHEEEPQNLLTGSAR